MSFEKVKKCVVCGGDNFSDVYNTTDRHYGITGSYTIATCNNCGLFFLNPMPTGDDLTALYPKTYYSYQPDFFNKQQSFLKTFYKNHIVKVETLDPEFAVPGRVLDIGCGSGEFLYKMKNKGWEVFGVEVNDNAARLGNELANLNIHSGDLLSTSYEPQSFDYIRSNHSFEHITNPKEVLDKIFTLLKPNGKLMIGVPNIDSFNYKLFKKYWWYLGAPVHPYNYSVKTLSRLLENHNFKVEKVSYNGDWSGFIGSYQIYLNRNRGQLSNKGFFINNIFIRAFSQLIAKTINAFKAGDAIEIICVKATA